MSTDRSPAKWIAGCVGPAALALVMLTAYVPPAEATVTSFSNRADWLAALRSGVTNIDFEGIAPAGGQQSFANLTVSGVSFGRASVADPGLGSFISGWGTGATIFGFAGSFGTTGTISFSTPVLAIGFDYGATCVLVGAPCSPQGVRLTLPDLTVIDASGPIPPMAFIGITSDVPLIEVSLAFAKTIPVVDNFSFGISAVPEPSTLLLFGLGLLVLLSRRDPLALTGWGGRRTGGAPPK